MPPWSARNAGDRVIYAFVTGSTTQSQRPLIIRPSRDAVNVRIASVCLAREIGHGVAIQTSWTRENRVDFLPLRCRSGGNDSHIVCDHAKVIPVKRAGI